MGKEVDELKIIKVAPKEQDSPAKNLSEKDLHKYGRVIKEFAKELANIDTELVKGSESFLILLIQTLGSNKTKKVIKNLSSSIYNHIFSIYKLDNGKLLTSVLNEIKEVSYTRIIDLFNALYTLQIEDIQGIRILSRVTSLLKGLDKLSNAIKIQDNYVKEIIYNRPHFDFKAKVKSILRASKISEGTYVIKYGNLFLNTEKDGNITAEANKCTGESRALGLFTDDMRFINRYEIKIFDKNNQELSNRLNHSENHNFLSCDENVYGKNITVKRQRVINGALFEKLEFINSSEDAIKVKIILSNVIKDIFEVRGKIVTDNKPSKSNIDCEGNVIMNTLLESGTYGVKILFSENGNSLCPAHIDEDANKLVYKLTLPKNSGKSINIRIQPLFNLQPYVDGELITEPPASFEEAMMLIENAKKTEFARIKIEGDIPNIQKTVDKCLKDLNMLVSYINVDGKLYSYIGAGLPRYSALFGRDSIITALEIFPLNQEIAKDTLELLAISQGKTFEERYAKELNEIKLSNWSNAVKNAVIKGILNYYIQREESPGKILHELRVGELADIGTIPHAPYYGTVDATPLWLILYAEYYKWSKDRKFLDKLLPNAEAALKWIQENMNDGYLRFLGSMYSKVKIQNQGWKDAGDSIRHLVNIKGNLSDPDYHIALAEVQGYVYKAFVMMSDIYKELGKFDEAESLVCQSSKLKARFNKIFWLEEEQFFSMALDRKNKPIPNVTSNIGQCMATGIIDENKIRIVEDKIISDEMYSGWGVRTLSNKCPAYDPLSYHNGSVWVHDTAFLATGLSQETMSKITKGLLEVANMFEDNRVPELFGGFQRKEGDTYIQGYPEACSPQAWASGGLIWLLLKIIGLQVENQEVTLDSLYIPDWLKSISIEGIKVGNRTVNIEKVYK